MVVTVGRLGTAEGRLVEWTGLEAKCQSVCSNTGWDTAMALRCA